MHTNKSRCNCNQEEPLVLRLFVAALQAIATSIVCDVFVTSMAFLHICVAAKLASQKPGSAHARSKAASTHAAELPAHSATVARSFGGRDGVREEGSQGGHVKENALERAPRGSLRAQACGAQGAFDFSTMPDEEFGLLRDGALETQGVDSGEEGEDVIREDVTSILGQESPRARDKTVHDGVLDRKTGRAAVRTGLPKDTFRTVVQYDGSLFNPFSAESSDGLRAKMLYGFRSKALSLQVKLAERLRLATDCDKRFATFQQAFEEVIRVDLSFSEILSEIKGAYDERIGPVKDDDVVTLAAYEALRNRERIEAERNASLQEEMDKLRELAAQGNLARRLIKDQGLEHLLEDTAEAGPAGEEGAAEDVDVEDHSKPAMLGEMQRLEALVGHLQAQVESERADKARLQEALQEMMDSRPNPLPKVFVSVSSSLLPSIPSSLLPFLPRCLLLPTLSFLLLDAANLSNGHAGLRPRSTTAAARQRRGNQRAIWRSELCS